MSPILSLRRPARRSEPWDWPPAPLQTRGGLDDGWIEYDLDGDGRADYVQRLREGYKCELQFPERAGRPALTVQRPGPASAVRPFLLLLLDGVAHERIRGLYDAGHFRLFRPPARLISVFPTLTDPAYDVLFGTGPTPGFEAGHFDRRANRLRNGFLWHLFGWNEAWVRHLDYRLPFIEDAVMYLFPRWVFPRELRRCRRVLDAQRAAGRRQVVLYILSTDGLGHMLRPEGIDEELRRLDRWIERVVYDHRGDLDIVALADHGLGRVPPGCAHVQPFDLRAVLRAAGLRVTRRLRRPGDVVVPVFGLLDVARLHTFDSATRDRAATVLRARPEIELVAVRDGERAAVLAGEMEAEISRREDASGVVEYGYRTLRGDPLCLGDGVLGCRLSQPVSARFASVAEWLQLSDPSPYPLAPPRLWNAFFAISREQPDLIVSLNSCCFVGSGLLNRFVRMQGTHGGLHRRATETFLMSTSHEPPSPMNWHDVGPWLEWTYGWHPGAPELGVREAPRR